MTEEPGPRDRSSADPSTAAGAAACPRRGGRLRRPAAVTILAVLQLISSAAYGVLFLAAIADGPALGATLVGRAATVGGPARDLEVAAIVALTGGIFVATLAAGVLLLRMRQLGWTITMLLAGLSLAASIAVWWTQGTALSIWILVQLVAVFYLNQRQVREAFGISRREVGSAPETQQP